MRAVYVCLMLVVLTRALSAQQEAVPSSQVGQNDPVAAQADRPPQPDSDGVYQAGTGVDLPHVFDATAASYPAEAAANEPAHICLFSAVVGADGELLKIRLVRSAGDAYDQAALDAVRGSRFAPGSVSGVEVPVQVQIRVPFVLNKPAVPRIVYRGPGMDAEGVTQPKPIFMKVAEYSEQARRKRISGIVVVAFTVSTEGLPTNLRVVNGMGYGLDEKALEAVRQYRFKPAMNGNAPVAVPITVEVNFKLF